jgi:predicted nucleic acid-binding protein
MTPVVVDAAFAGAWLLPDEHSRSADKVLRSILGQKLELSVPDLWFYELTNLLVSAHRRKRIGEEQVFEAHRLIDSIPCHPYEQQAPLARDRISRLALRFGLSAYDAAYLELADRLQSPLLTFDRVLNRAASTLGLGA